MATDFANVLAGHPAFAQAWAEKLCYYVNSQPCAVDDPEFQRIVGNFKASKYSWIAARPVTRDLASRGRSARWVSGESEPHTAEVLPPAWSGALKAPVAAPY